MEVKPSRYTVAHIICERVVGVAVGLHQVTVQEHLAIVSSSCKDLWGYFPVSGINEVLYFYTAEVRRRNRCVQLLFLSSITLVICCPLEMLCLARQNEPLLQLSRDCRSCLKIVSVAGLSGIYYIEL